MRKGIVLEHDEKAVATMYMSVSSEQESPQPSILCFFCLLDSQPRIFASFAFWFLPASLSLSLPNRKKRSRSSAAAATTVKREFRNAIEEKNSEFLQGCITASSSDPWKFSVDSWLCFSRGWNNLLESCRAYCVVLVLGMRSMHFTNNGLNGFLTWNCLI